MSQVLRWVDHPDLSRMEELLVHIANLRMPTADHLAAIMGISKKSVVQNIYLLNQKEKRTVESMKLRGVDSQKAYWLGRKACQIVEDATGMKVEYYEFSRKKGQGRHTKGINDILFRMIQMVGIKELKKHCEWWNTKGAKQEIFQLWKDMEQWDEQQAQEEYKTMLTPDARFAVADRAYWIEYDNDTKRRNDILEQFELYVLKLVPVQNKDPVVWITRDQKRRDELQTWWEEYKSKPTNSHLLQAMISRLQAEGKKLYLPKMYFFVAGEETKPLLTGQL